MSLTIRVVAHDELTHDGLAGIRALFDSEYLHDFGRWDPEGPYGYAPHDVHVIASDDGVDVGHVGWARREITVGDRPVMIAGVGGVLVADCARGQRVGERLIRRSVASMREADGIEFGYLGCREEVVPFYHSCGWRRVVAGERSIDRAGRPRVDPPGQPLLVLSLDPSSVWPDGEIDLRGRAW